MNKIRWLPRWLAAVFTFPVGLTLLVGLETIPEILADPTITTGTPALIGAVIGITTPLVLETIALTYLIIYIKNYKK